MTEPKAAFSGPGAVKRVQNPEQATVERLLCDAPFATDDIIPFLSAAVRLG
jgi:hypothetical protein